MDPNIEDLYPRRIIATDSHRVKRIWPPESAKPELSHLPKNIETYQRGRPAPHPKPLPPSPLCEGSMQICGVHYAADEIGSLAFAGRKPECDDGGNLPAYRCFASARRSPRSAKPACSSRSRRASSTSIASPASNSATNLTRHTSFGTSSPSSRERKTYRSRNKRHWFACSQPIPGAGG